MKIGLLGCGVVGSGVLKIIDEQFAGQMTISRILVRNPQKINDPRMTLHANSILNDPSIDVIVECIGGKEPCRTYVLEALKQGKHVVTANKKMLALCYEELFASARENNCTIGYEACVGGGIPWIHELEHMRRIDPVSSFAGIFNGTTNYILSRMSEDNMDFDEALKKAQELGYAEADPSDDIDGMDVRYKTAISCAAAFDCFAEPDSIQPYGIRHVSAQDIAWGKGHERVLKLIGSGSYDDGRLSACVRPLFLKKNNLLANVGLNFNAIQAVSKTLGPSVYYGQGAGSLPTAHAVVQDLLNISEGKNTSPQIHVQAAVCEDTVQFYIRTVNPEVFADVTAERIDARVLLTKKISRNEIDTLVKEAKDEQLFLAEVEE